MRRPQPGSPAVILAVVCLLSVLTAERAAGQPAPPAPQPPRADANGWVKVAPYTASPSEYMSPEARKQFTDEANRLPISAYQGLADQRWAYDHVYMAPRLARALAVYPVTMEATTLGGVRATVVTPQAGVAPKNRGKVIINLHAGAFIYGKASTVGVVESAPIASLGAIRVISVDYRLGPEHPFPAAVQDVAAVYRELLKTYRPQNIGLYGCSSGGQLSGLAMSWFRREKLPPPGAIAVFCAGIDGVMGGDARFIAMPLMGRNAPPPAAIDAAPMPAPNYFGGAGRSDPLVFPSFSPAVLQSFPPTLFVTASRDFAASAAAHAHNQLTKAGVEADLHVWDGLWHAFTNEVDLPESKEAYAVAVRFFDRHLGRRR